MSLALAALLSLALHPGAARAEPDSQPSECASAECARVAFQRGVAAYQRKDYAAAVRYFRAAIVVKRHPSVLLNLGLAEARAGMPVEAVRDLLEVERSEDASPDVRASAREARELAERDRARLILEQAEGATLEVDGRVVPAAGTGVRLNPGRHQLRVTRDGAIIEREVELAAGETLRISLDRARELVLVMPKVDAAAAPNDRGTGKLSPAWFYVGLGTTLLVSGFATWSALDTQSAFDEYERDLPQLSQSEIDEQVSSGHALERRTNWLIGGGLFAGVATGVLAAFFVDWGGPSHAAKLAPQPKTKISAQFGPGVGGIQLGGSF